MQFISDLSDPFTLAVVGTAIAVTAIYAATQPKKKAVDNASELHLAQRVPGSSYLLGDFPAYLRNADRILDWMTDVSQQVNGELWRMVIPGQGDLVIITDPDVVEEVMHSKMQSFPRGDAARQMLDKMFGFGLPASDGERWLHQRKAGVKFFTAKSLRTWMTTCIRKNVGQMHTVIDQRIADGETLELRELFHAFTMQTFAEVGLGVKLDWIRMREPNPVEQAVVKGVNLTWRRYRLPTLLWKLESALNIGAERELADASNEMRAWLRSMIDEGIERVTTRAPASSETEEIKSMVELFMEHSEDGVEGMGPEDLVDFIITFVLTAYDTSAVVLSWFFLAIMKHPEVAVKIRQEMASTGLQASDPSTYLTTDHVKKLVYLEAAIKETLRLHPAAPLFQRECIKDEVVGGNIFIPKGSQIGVAPYPMARLTKLWGPDAAEFKPERWIDAVTGELIHVPSNKFTSFGHGPRNCIGMKLAMLELRVVTANLLHRYEFALAAPNSGMYIPALSLVLKDTVLVHAKHAAQAHAA